MSKKTNTILLMLAGTAINVVLAVVIILLLFVLYSRFLAHLIPEQVAQLAIPVIFILGLFLTFKAYKVIMGAIMSKLDMDKDFDPLLMPRRKPPRKD
jgi:hypothetical protein